MDFMLPKYVPPCLSQTNNSVESRWLNSDDFGECYGEVLDILTYPRVIPVYNGKVLEIDSDFVHASLSGISIKHYYGKCFEEEMLEDGLLGNEPPYGDFYGEGYWYAGKDWSSIASSESLLKVSLSSSKDTSSGSSEHREIQYVEGQPPCTLPKINYRNSFWNIHRPELCKLTWGQNYVGASTVTEHLHEHLMQHGDLCKGFHTQEDRNKLVTKELNEYVRLKPLACPRELPPDEPPFNFKDPSQTKKLVRQNCKTVRKVLIPRNPPNEDRYIQLSDDEDIKEKSIHRSKEEFCLTIGKHIRKLPMTQPQTPPPAKEEEEKKSFKSISYGEEDRNAEESFHYDWFLYNGEEDFDQSLTVGSSSYTEEEAEPCTLHILDEFCKAAGKVDLSDLRCPDF